MPLYRVSQSRADRLWKGRLDRSQPRLLGESSSREPFGLCNDVIRLCPLPSRAVFRSPLLMYRLSTRAALIP